MRENPKYYNPYRGHPKKAPPNLGVLSLCQLDGMRSMFLNCLRRCSAFFRPGSLKGGFIWDHIGDWYRGYKGNTVSLGYMVAHVIFASSLARNHA